MGFCPITTSRLSPGSPVEVELAVLERLEGPLGVESGDVPSRAVGSAAVADVLQDRAAQGLVPFQAMRGGRQADESVRIAREPFDKSPAIRCLAESQVEGLRLMHEGVGTRSV